MHVNMSSDCYNERDDSTRYHKKSKYNPINLLARRKLQSTEPGLLTGLRLPLDLNRFEACDISHFV